MYYFIVNQTGGSGRGKKTWAKVKEILEQKKVEYKVLFTETDVPAGNIAKNILSLDGEKNIVVVGGDGTINEVLNGIGKFENINFGLIPTGSGNDFARGLGISKSTKKAVHRILNSKSTIKIDLGRVRYDDGKSKFFGISSGVGLDAIVCKKALNSKIKKVLNRFGLGQAVYIIYTVITLFSMQTETLKIKCDNDDSLIFDKTIFMAMMNFCAEGGGVKMCPDAKPNDGKISVCLVHGIKKFKTFFLLPFLMAGKHKKFKGFELFDCDKIEINFNAPQTLHLDGEYGGEIDHIVVESVKEKLNVIA